LRCHSKLHQGFGLARHSMPKICTTMHRSRGKSHKAAIALPQSDSHSHVPATDLFWLWRRPSNIATHQWPACKTIACYSGCEDLWRAIQPDNHTMLHVAPVSAPQHGPATCCHNASGKGHQLLHGHQRVRPACRHVQRVGTSPINNALHCYCSAVQTKLPYSCGLFLLSFSTV
jgi:hypothetical protein